MVKYDINFTFQIYLEMFGLCKGVWIKRQQNNRTSRGPTIDSMPQIWIFNIPPQVVEKQFNGVVVGFGKLMDQFLHSLNLLCGLLDFCWHRKHDEMFWFQYLFFIWASRFTEKLMSFPSLFHYHSSSNIRTSPNTASLPRSLWIIQTCSRRSHSKCFNSKMQIYDKGDM